MPTTFGEHRAQSTGTRKAYWNKGRDVTRDADHERFRLLDLLALEAMMRS